MQALQLSALLIERGLMQRNQAENSLQLAQTQQIPFISLLIRQRSVDTHTLAQIIAEVFACPLLDISALNIDFKRNNNGLMENPEQLRLLINNRVLPLMQRKNVLHLAMADPACLGNLSSHDIFRNVMLQPVIVDAKKLDIVLEKLSAKHLDPEGTTLHAQAAIELIVLNDDAADDEAGTNNTDNEPVDEAPVVRYVNQILLDAVRLRASDIHIEPFEAWCRIRYRIDGMLREGARAPAKFSARLSSRLKVMASLDITERRRPQDGRIRLRLANTRSIDLRISTLPTLWGEKIVIRVLDANAALITLDQLGCTTQQRQLYQQSLDGHQGMILVTGPTGSGKTVTLYSGLAHLNAGERNIATAEDPVEINLEGINQVAVNRRSGLDFATALRAFLRQDPDVVMLGEIRDQETADIAVKAAQTGHLVLSTLHTNSAADTIIRLLNMGVEAYNLASALSLIISQRLVRRLCPHCSVWSDIKSQEIACWPADQAPEKVRQPIGCTQCEDGYKGRVALMEMLPVTAEIRHLISHQCDITELQRIARESGWPCLAQSALAKVTAGETSLQEIRRVLS
ncbi:MAG: Flp pilus assembly complex ATPase component TadA [Gammaproteobacteria bacterium]|nr:Flp pilus assembly complex ATPase component TadA [Gammaproteobacteria bacterium]